MFSINIGITQTEYLKMLSDGKSRQERCIQADHFVNSTCIRTIFAVFEKGYAVFEFSDKKKNVVILRTKNMRKAVRCLVGRI